MRRLMFCCFLLSACVSDRPRPDPTSLHDTPLLAANINKPDNNATLLGVHPVDIRVFGSEIQHSTLTGVGFVIRRNGVKVDSITAHFSERHDTTVVFSYNVPDFPTNTHLSIFGLAFGPDETFAVSEPVIVNIIRCSPGIQGC